MYKKIFFSFLLVFLTIKTYAQEQATRTNQIEIGIGGIMGSFQDVRFSDVRYNGFGGSFEARYTHKGKYIWNIVLEGVYENEKGKTHRMEATDFRIDLPLTFLFPLSKTEKQSIYLGAKSNIMEFFLRTDQNLTNNSATLIMSNYLRAAFLYTRTINSDWKLEANAELQLLAYAYLGTSFSYAAPQQELDNGDYDYNGISSPRYIIPLWDYFAVETNIRFHYKRRWILGYRWNMWQQTTTAKMPMTLGYNNLYVAFKVMNKIKISLNFEK